MTARRRRTTQVVLACIILVTRMLPAFSSSRVTVAVVFSRDAAPYQQALKGFTDHFDEAGRPHKIHEFYIGGSIPRDRLIARIRAKQPDLILTIGSAATDLVTAEVRDIPIVFSLVLPASGRRDLQEMMSDHGNVAGTSMEIPVETQFRELRKVLPAMKRVGVLYDPSITGESVAVAEQAARQLGIELVKVEVGPEDDVLERTEEIASEIDALWSVADSTVFSPNGLRQILLATLRHRVPFVGLSPSFVKAGALVALSVDYRDVGRQSGELGARILAGEEPSSLPLASPRVFSLSVNMNTAEQIQVSIGEDVKGRAQLFF